MRQILQPVYIADKCTLMEAVYWAAFSIYPLFSLTDNGVDEREDEEHCDVSINNQHQNVTYFFTKENCEKYSLPLNPAIIYYEENGELPYDFSFTLEQIESLRKSATSSSEDMQTIVREYEEAEERKKKQKAFDEALFEYLEIPKAELFLYLRKGKILSYGRLIPPGQDWVEMEELPEYTTIPHTAWKPQNINLEESSLHTNQGSYIYTLIDVESLFLAFPEPEPEVTQVYSIGAILG